MKRIQDFLDDIKENKTSWIQELNKEELLNIFGDLKLTYNEQNVEVLRKTLRELVKSGKLWSDCQGIMEGQSHSSKALTEPIVMKMNTSYGNIEKFDGNNFELFEQQLECVICLNDIPKTKQTPLLITNLSIKVLETLTHLCSPDKPIKKDYAELMQILQARYTKSNLKPWPVPPSPWYRIHADYLGPLFGKMFLIIVDSFSKWPEVFLMANIGSGLTIEKFKETFVRFGYPIHLVTDNGTSFTSHDFKAFCKKLGIEHTFTPPHHPATNGAAERFVETFKSNVTKIVESGKSLNYATGIFLADYRITPHKATGVSPARLMLGREIRNRFSLLRPTPIFQEISIKQSKMKDAHGGSRDVHFKVGQKVMTRDYRKGQKPWTEGIVIEESIPGATYYIDVNGLRWKRHVNQILNCSQNIS